MCIRDRTHGAWPQTTHSVRWGRIVPRITPSCGKRRRHSVAPFQKPPVCPDLIGSESRFLNMNYIRWFQPSKGRYWINGSKNSKNMRRTDGAKRTADPIKHRMCQKSHQDHRREPVGQMLLWAQLWSKWSVLVLNVWFSILQRTQAATIENSTYRKLTL